jgi:O-antigen ligase
MMLVTRRILLIGIGFSLPISTAVTNILLVLLMIYLAVDLAYKYLNKNYIKVWHPLSIAAGLLLLMLAVGSIYSPAAPEQIIDNIKQYKEFLLIPIFLYLFQDNMAKNWGLQAFLIAILITLGLSYLIALTGYSLYGIIQGEPDNAFVFKNHITQGTLMALAAYFIAILGYYKKNYWYFLIAALMVYNVLFLTQGRSGYLMLACLGLVLGWQILHWRGFLIASVIVLILGLGSYHVSDTVQQRVDKVVAGWQHQAGELDSIQLRLEFMQYSWQLWQQRPIFGFGTGSFIQSYANMQPSHLTNNPHNEYLMIMVQWGMVGLGIFLWFIYLLWYLIRFLPQPQQKLAVGLFVTVAVGCVFNSFFLDFTEGHSFAYLIGILYCTANRGDDASI